MNLLLSELPDGVYAIDRADNPDKDKRSYSSSELRAHAQMLADLYSNLEDINSDKFATTVTPEGLAAWERQLFQTAVDGSLTYAERQTRILTKLRASGGISYPFIRAIVAAILDPIPIDFEIVTYCGFNGGAWILDVSPLDEDTYLSAMDPLLGARRDLDALDCNLDYAAAGLTAQDLIDIQTTAYTYEVRILGIADAATLAQLEQQLTQLEPARSTHVIYNDFPGPVAP